MAGLDEDFFDVEVETDSNEGKYVMKFFKTHVQPLLGELAKDGSGALKKGSNKAVNFVFNLPDPTLDNVNKHGSPDPSAFAAANSKVVVLSPQYFYNSHFKRPKCPCCRKETNVKGEGWSNKCRRVLGLGTVYYIIQTRWRCKECEGMLYVRPASSMW